jgi:RHS repeat-associated protein
MRPSSRAQCSAESGWNQADDLTSNTGGPSDLNVSYAYDGNALLQSATNSGTTTQLTWDTSSGLPLMIVDGSTNIIYGPNNLPLEQIGSNNQPIYYHHDQLGSTRLLTNAAGSPVETINYSPYGTPTISSGTALTNLLFAGQYTDPNNGLIYMRARWYDPGTGQFLSVDPEETQTGAAYYYASDNPTDDVDPSGQFPVGFTGNNSGSLQLIITDDTEPIDVSFRIIGVDLIHYMRTREAEGVLYVSASFPDATDPPIYTHTAVHSDWQRTPILTVPVPPGESNIIDAVLYYGNPGIYSKWVSGGPWTFTRGGGHRLPKSAPEPSPQPSPEPPVIPVPIPIPDFPPLPI